MKTSTNVKDQLRKALRSKFPRRSLDPTTEVHRLAHIVAVELRKNLAGSSSPDGFEMTLMAITELVRIATNLYELDFWGAIERTEDPEDAGQHAEGLACIKELADDLKNDPYHWDDFRDAMEGFEEAIQELLDEFQSGRVPKNGLVRRHVLQRYKLAALLGPILKILEREWAAFTDSD